MSTAPFKNSGGLSIQMKGAFYEEKSIFKLYPSSYGKCL